MGTKEAVGREGGGCFLFSLGDNGPNLANKVRGMFPITKQQGFLGELDAPPAQPGTDPSSYPGMVCGGCELGPP